MGWQCVRGGESASYLPFPYHSFLILSILKEPPPLTRFENAAPGTSRTLHIMQYIKHCWAGFPQLIAGFLQWGKNKEKQGMWEQISKVQFRKVSLETFCCISYDELHHLSVSFFFSLYHSFLQSIRKPFLHFLLQTHNRKWKSISPKWSELPFVKVITRTGMLIKKKSFAFCCVEKHNILDYQYILFQWQWSTG